MNNMASRNPDDLHPDLQVKWKQLRLQANEKGIELILTCTHRPDSEQEYLYSLGRTKPGHRVTWAKPGESKHNKYPAEAFDVVILRHGKCVWETSDPDWKVVGALGVALGLEWAGNWSDGKKEMPHFQL